MNKLVYIPLLLAGLSITSVGFTAGGEGHREGGVYLGFVGAGAGYYTINNDDFLGNDEDLTDNGGAWQGYAGIEAGRFLALEGVYTDFGKATDGKASTELTTLSAAVLFHLPLGGSVAPYAKAGMMSWDRTRSFGSVSSSDEGDDAFLGLGVRFSMAPGIDTRLEYEGFEIDETAVDMISVNMQFRF